MSKMFMVNGKRIPSRNPLGGRCPHECTYCWSMGANGLVKKYNMTKYQGRIQIDEDELNKPYRPDMLYFMQDMSDLFANQVLHETIELVLDTIRNNPQTDFLLLTKNPKRYEEFVLPMNAIAGATIETNRWKLASKYSKAPLTFERYEAMRYLEHKRKMVSIEPIMDFDSNIFADWIFDIEPKFVYIGYDNYNNGLIEPTLNKTKEFIDYLEQIIEVRTKTLER